MTGLFYIKIYMEFDLSFLDGVKDPRNMLKELYRRVKGYKEDLEERGDKAYPVLGTSGVVLAEAIINWIRTEAKNF